MLMRSIVGSLAAVGVIGGLAAALPEHNPLKKSAPAPVQTYGDLSKTAPGVTAAANQGSESDKQSLVKLAAYSVPRDATQGSQTPPAPEALVRAVRIVGPVVTPPSSAPVAVASAAPSQTLPPASAPSSVVPAPAIPSAPPPQPAPPQQTAALPPAQQPAPETAGRINLNRASIAELDHLPGGGRIGVAIARRRPYHSVDDLVRKRVLRASTFARIRSAVTVD